MTDKPATTPDRPEFERLMKRLGVDEGRLINFHVSWGPDAHKLTPEERCAAINRAMDTAGPEILDVDNGR